MSFLLCLEMLLLNAHTSECLIQFRNRKRPKLTEEDSEPAHDSNAEVMESPAHRSSMTNSNKDQHSEGGSSRSSKKTGADGDPREDEKITISNSDDPTSQSDCRKCPGYLNN
uniref:Uncharacterized protein n=1 Tax=Euplotes crassus TaxID=5936 RepID=A0A7S3K6B1_EUPCR|mmetsp:Transcript_11938/g.11940  ORF Transcript_11938/g.11940 Transcript_11938/m.11940 type:complete len:112 (+) Transcript_11938:566-901(+)